MRRQTSSRSRRDSTVHRRASTTADVQVSMLPDLSENLPNEQTTWEDIMQIKAMPVPMAQKKDMKAKILVSKNSQGGCIKLGSIKLIYLFYPKLC